MSQKEARLKNSMLQSSSKIIHNLEIPQQKKPEIAAFALILVALICTFVHFNYPVYAIILVSAMVVFSRMEIEFDPKILFFFLLVGLLQLFLGISSSLESALYSLAKLFTYFSLFYLGYCFCLKYGKTAVNSFLLILRDFVLIGCLFSFIVETLGESELLILLGDHINPYLGSQGIIGIRAQSFFTHPIVFAQFVVVAFFINFYLERDKTKKLVISIVLICFLYLAQARSAWLTFCILAAIAFCIYIKESRNYALLTVLICFAPLLLIVGAASGLFEPVLVRFTNVENDASFTQRGGAIISMLGSLVSNPVNLLFGFGESSASHYIASQTIVLEGFTTADNGWLTLFYDYGLVGLGGLLVGLVSCIRKCVKTPSLQNKAMLIGIIFCISSMLFVYEGFNWTPTIVLFFFVLGVMNAKEDMYI